MSDAPETIALGRDTRYVGHPWQRLTSPYDEETEVDEYTRSDLCITRADADAMVAAERAIWTQAIEIYFDTTAVMDVEKHVERLRAEGRGEKEGK